MIHRPRAGRRGVEGAAAEGNVFGVADAGSFVPMGAWGRGFPGRVFSQPVRSAILGGPQGFAPFGRGRGGPHRSPNSSGPLRPGFPLRLSLSWRGDRNSPPRDTFRIPFGHPGGYPRRYPRGGAGSGGAGYPGGMSPNSRAMLAASRRDRAPRRSLAPFRCFLTAGSERARWRAIWDVVMLRPTRVSTSIWR